MEYHNNIGMDKKIAIYIGGIGKNTDYIYDSGQSLNNITVMQRSNIIDIFDNLTGKKLFEVKDVESFKLGMHAIIFNDGKHYGAYSYDGKYIFKPEYLSIKESKNYFITVNEDGKRGLFKWNNNKLTQIIKPTECIDIRVQDKGIVLYKEINEIKVKGYYSLEGKEIIEPKYLNMDFNSAGIYVSTIDGKMGFFSYSGKAIVPPLYEGIGSVNNSFIVYKQTKRGVKKYGLYTKDGTQILKPRYKMYIAKSPYAKFSAGKLESLYDLITGKRILPLKFKFIDVYYNVIYATEDLKTFTLYSAKTGKKLLKDKFNIVKIYAPYILRVVKDEHSYYYLTQYNVLVDSEKYDVEYSDEYREVLISKKGKEIKVLFAEWINKQR